MLTLKDAFKALALAARADSVPEFGAVAFVPASQLLQTWDGEVGVVVPECAIVGGFGSLRVIEGGVDAHALAGWLRRVHGEVSCDVSDAHVCLQVGSQRLKMRRLKPFEPPLGELRESWSAMPPLGELRESWSAMAMRSLQVSEEKQLTDAIVRASKMMGDDPVRPWASGVTLIGCRDEPAIVVLAATDISIYSEIVYFPRCRPVAFELVLPPRFVALYGKLSRLVGPMWVEQCADNRVVVAKHSSQIKLFGRTTAAPDAQRMDAVLKRHATGETFVVTEELRNAVATVAASWKTQELTFFAVEDGRMRFTTSNSSGASVSSWCDVPRAFVGKFEGFFDPVILAPCLERSDVVSFSEDAIFCSREDGTLMHVIACARPA